ncbi:hypothetical protein PM082_016267 [Marasmius tenuissimus]|nr:hypothetical protein PM082_016267 [Marasmius tenuissimus]
MATQLCTDHFSEVLLELEGRSLDQFQEQVRSMEGMDRGTSGQIRSQSEFIGRIRGHPTTSDGTNALLVGPQGGQTPAEMTQATVYSVIYDETTRYVVRYVDRDVVLA